MRYLTLSADYLALSLRDEQAGEIPVTDLGLPAELVDELLRWNARYEEVIPLSTAERRGAAGASLIDELDRDGRRLADRVASACGRGTQVRYYSEGRLGYVDGAP